ncbi:MAG TPA: hypothetical protein VGJ57_11140 [Nitrospirales bacterium]|jgi:hypothetical protein
MKSFVIGTVVGCVLTAAVSLGFDSKMWRFGAETGPSEKLDQIQYQHRAILEQQDRLERLFQQICVRAS